MDTTFPMLCFNTSGSLLSCAQGSQWAKMVSIFHCFSALQPVNSTNNLSKKESLAFFADIFHYLEIIDTIKQ